MSSSLNGKLQICFFAGSALPDLGGVEVVMDALARGFVALGHGVTLVAPWPSGAERPDDTRYPYRVHRHAPYPRWIEDPGVCLGYLRGAPGPGGFDVVHCHGIYPQAYLAALARNDLGAALVATSHGGDLGAGMLTFYGPEATARAHWGIARMDALIAVNRAYREVFLRHATEPARVVEIPHGVDPARFATAVPRPAALDPGIRAGSYALFLGRLTRQKGVHLLLEALQAVPADGGVELVIAGTGREEGALRADCARLGLRDRVRFVGWIEGSLKTYLLQSCLCLVAPSLRREAFGLSVLECHAAGRPAIASDIPGLDERVEPGRSGILVRPNSPDALAAALLSLRRRPDRADEMGRQARAAASRYGLDLVVERHLALYARVLGSPRARRGGGKENLRAGRRA